MKRGDVDIDINVRSNYGQTALFLAAERGYVDIVTLLLSHPSVDVSAQDHDLQTALGCAIFNGRIEVVALLLQDPSVRTDMMDVDGMTPWTWAIQKRRSIILSLLFESLGIDPNQAWVKRCLRGSSDVEPPKAVLFWDTRDTVAPAWLQLPGQLLQTRRACGGGRCMHSREGRRAG